MSENINDLLGADPVAENPVKETPAAVSDPAEAKAPVKAKAKKKAVIAVDPASADGDKTAVAVAEVKDGKVEVIQVTNPKGKFDKLSGKMPGTVTVDDPINVPVQRFVPTKVKGGDEMPKFKYEYQRILWSKRQREEI